MTCRLRGSLNEPHRGALSLPQTAWADDASQPVMLATEAGSVVS